MEVKIDKAFPIKATPEMGWAILGNVNSVATCMPGAQLIDQLDETHYKGVVKTKIGPAVMTFNGDIEVLLVNPESREIQMIGKGSDKGGSSASMKLVARIESGRVASECKLVGQSTVAVSGKLAQLGNRLLLPVTDVLLAQFARNFEAAASALAAASPEVTSVQHEEPLSSKAPAQPKVTPSELNGLALLLAVLRNSLARLFGRRA